MATNSTLNIEQREISIISYVSLEILIIILSIVVYSIVTLPG